MTYTDESDVQTITVTNVATGGRETFTDFDTLADRVSEYGHDLVQSFGGGSSITLRFDVKYAEPEPEVEDEADAYDVDGFDVEELESVFAKLIRFLKG